MQNKDKLYHIMLQDKASASQEKILALHAYPAFLPPWMHNQDTLQTQCYFAGDASAFLAFNVPTSADIPEGEKFNTLIIRSTQNKLEMRGLLAQATFLADTKATIIVAQSNDQGAKTLEKDIKTAFKDVDIMIKNKCRGFQINLSGGSDYKLLKEWLDNAKLHFCEDNGFWTQAGLFGWNKIDQGSKLLTNTIAEREIEISGDIADFGCGYGYLSKTLSLNPSFKPTSLTLSDHDIRALNAAKINLEDIDTEQEFLWRDLSAPTMLNKKLDVVMMNPPFHEGRQGTPDLGLQFIENAYKNLKKGGVLYMVANKHLPYETHLKASFKVIECLIEKDGFKVIKGQK